jgi:hypothetical protein
MGIWRFVPFGFRWTALFYLRTLDNQTLRGAEDVMGLSNLTILAEMLGGYLGIAAAQAVFISQLSREIPKTGSDLSVLWGGGTSNFRERLSGETLDTALSIFRTAIMRSVFPAAAASALPFGIIGSILFLMVTPLGWALAAWWWLRKRKANVQRSMVQPQSYQLSPIYPTRPRYLTHASKKHEPTLSTQGPPSSTEQGTRVSDYSRVSSTLRGTTVSDSSQYPSTLPNSEIGGQSNFTQEEAREHTPGPPPAPLRSLNVWWPDRTARAPVGRHELPSVDHKKVSRDA